MSTERITLAMIEALNAQTVGQDILRYVSLPELLGSEKDTLLYFIGRKLARKIQMDEINDLFYLFYTFNWGKLELIKEKKKQMTFHLMADEIVKRMDSPLPIDFQLEAGFLAEGLQQITGRPAECNESVNDRLYRVQFNVHFTDV